jgi:hypothetical protein
MSADPERIAHVGGDERRLLRYYLEVEVSGLSAKEVRETKAELEEAVIDVLEEHGIAGEITARRKTRTHDGHVFEVFPRGGRWDGTPLPGAP